MALSVTSTIVGLLPSRRHARLGDPFTRGLESLRLRAKLIDDAAHGWALRPVRSQERRDLAGRTDPAQRLGDESVLVPARRVSGQDRDALGGRPDGLDDALVDKTLP